MKLVKPKSLDDLPRCPRCRSADILEWSAVPMEWKCVACDNRFTAPLVYIPLRVDPAWAGTVRHCVLERDLFEQKFEYVSEGLPSDLGLEGFTVGTVYHPAKETGG